ncbi:hypothetical protein MG296_10410 [Flavobacteriaceae bacterium TK19130]|nr:hypothetical protein [Thermobacterium salinum]
MKKLYIIVLGAGLLFTTSCATTQKTQSESDLAGYTLKNKKELMKQKIAPQKKKTFVATP